MNPTTLYDFDDILIQPATSSPINSRKEVNVLDENKKLPLMTAPMDTVISEENLHLFKELGVIPVLPRTTDSGFVNTSNFQAYGIEEFEQLFVKDKIQPVGDEIFYALIDIANGHMERLINLVQLVKVTYKTKICLMVGNVANPETFRLFNKTGVDYVRIGIGNGGGCLTTVQTGVGYPMASLIKNCYDIKKMYYSNTKIVADGGFKKYSDVIKALALGADYVMLGSIFNKALESAGETTTVDGTLVNQFHPHSKQMFEVGIPLYKHFRGMSTKEVQIEWGKDDLKTSEGVVREHKVEYTLKSWIENFEGYLRSAMSYTGKKELHDFIGGVTYNLISQNSFRRFDK